MKFRLLLEPQEGVHYETLLAFAQRAEARGFDGLFFSDHVLHQGSGDGGAGPLEPWTALAGISRETTSLRLGTLVSSVTFRHPSMLALQVAAVDEMSHGRVELGLGAGWFDDEHRAYGIPFPKQRFGILEEQLEVITGLWSSDGPYSHSGTHYELNEAPALRKPVQSTLPVIVGGAGPKRTPALAARFATEYNAVFEADPAPAYVRAREACEAIGRDPRSLVYSVCRVSILGRDLAEHRRRVDALHDDPRIESALPLAPTVTEAIDEIGRLRGAGAERLYLQVMDFGDIDQLDLIAEEIFPHFR